MFLVNAMNLLAQADGKQDAPGAINFLSNPMFLLILLLVVFYIFMFRNKQKDERNRKNMLSAIKKGDKVQTIGGIMGTVMEARETEVVLKVDESTNTRMRFVRSAIHRVVESDEKK